MTDTTLTPSPPWHRRSPLWDHEDEIRRLRAEGFSLQQITDRLGFGITRQALHEFLRRADAERGEAALAAMDDSGFIPPT